MHSMRQLELFEKDDAGSWGLPKGYQVRTSSHFSFDRIILSKGSIDTPERELFVREICAAYPEASVEEQAEAPHNRIDLGEADSVKQMHRGKRTLVFGVLGLKSAVWRNPHHGAMYPYEQFFSVYGFCPFSCSYCYLNDSPGTSVSPTVRVYVNLREIISEIDKRANASTKRSVFYLGKLQDGLALDPLTAFSTVLVPFFGNHRFARQVIQTKSVAVERLLNLEHKGHTTLSWTLTPPNIAARYERHAPNTAQRIGAMVRCAEAGYPVCANVAPVIPEEGWEDAYLDFIRDLLASVPLRRLYVGGICLDQNSLRFLEHYVGLGNAILTHLDPRMVGEGNHVSYPPGFCSQLFERVLAAAGQIGPFHSICEHWDGGTLSVDFTGGKNDGMASECQSEKTIGTGRHV